MIENNTEHSLTISFLKSVVRQNFVRSDKTWNSVRPMSDKTLKYFDSTVCKYLCCDNALASFVMLKRFNDHDGADSSRGISSEDYHTGQ